MCRNLLIFVWWILIFPSPTLPFCRFLFSVTLIDIASLYLHSCLCFLNIVLLMFWLLKREFKLMFFFLLFVSFQHRCTKKLVKVGIIKHSLSPYCNFWQIDICSFPCVGAALPKLPNCCWPEGRTERKIHTDKVILLCSSVKVFLHLCQGWQRKGGEKRERESIKMKGKYERDIER